MSVRFGHGPRLTLYIAGSTPNSVRAQHNLAVAMAEVGGAPATLSVEIIDVFVEPKRAMRDGVMVTPTLVRSENGERVVIVGDLGQGDQLRAVLARAVRVAPPPAAAAG